MRAAVDEQLSLAPGLRVPEPPYFLGSLLVPESENLAGQMFMRGEGKNFDASGEPIKFAPTTGKVRVQLTLTNKRSNLWTITHLSSREPQVLEIADVPGRQSFEVRLESRRFRREFLMLRTRCIKH